MGKVNTSSYFFIGVTDSPDTPPEPYYLPALEIKIIQVYTKV